MSIEISKSLSCRLANVGFVCACLVVCLHIPSRFEQGTCSWWIWSLTSSRGLASAAVPMFFAISGFLIAGHFLETGWWRREFSKRLRSLLVPYCFWNVFYLIFVMALNFLLGRFGVRYGSVTFADLDMSHVLSALGFGGSWHCQLPFLWFVRCLIVFAAVGPLFLFVRHRKAGGLIVIALFVLYALLPYLLPPAADWKVHFWTYAWMKGVTYFSLGAYMRWHGGQLLSRQSLRKGLSLLVIGMSFLFFALLLEGAGSRASAFCGFLGCNSIILGAWLALPQNPLPRFLHGRAFPIFLLQSLVIIFLLQSFALHTSRI